MDSHVNAWRCDAGARGDHEILVEARWPRSVLLRKQLLVQLLVLHLRIAQWAWLVRIESELAVHQHDRQMV